jgi:hypothetical protein
MRKVFVPIQTKYGPTRELLWARQTSKNTVQITNIPFFTDAIAFNDIVRVNTSGEVVEVLKSCTRTRHATYLTASDREEAYREWKAICDHLARFAIDSESPVPGLFSMAVPPDVTDDDLDDICDNCPIRVELYAPLNSKIHRA